MRTVQLGPRSLQFPSNELGVMKESNAKDIGLRQQLEEDGYLLLRGILNRSTVLRARTTVLQHYKQQQDTATAARNVINIKMEGCSGIAVAPDVTAVTEASDLFEYFSATLFGGEKAMTFRYKWLRGVTKGNFTGVHCDNVYMGRGATKRLFTVWIPFGDIPVEQGTLAVCPGSHRLSSFARVRETYGNIDVDRDRREGWLTKDPMEITEKFGSRWLTADFQMGDVLLFGMHTLHASTTNLTDEVRLSCDVRFQPADDNADPRWTGEDCSGHVFHGNTKLGTLDDIRAALGMNQAF